MGYSNETSDFEKLQLAVKDLLTMFGSVDDVLEAFGLADMPTAQRYGILFGFITFVCTVSAVLLLLILGGSFRRIAEESATGTSGATVLSASQAREKRALLLERLLQGRERMLKHYHCTTTTGRTKLTQMMLNQAPDPPNENNGNNNNQTTTTTRFIPECYQDNYVYAYRRCQDKPGGSILSGRPEARFEAYARAFAGCGPYTTMEYRRSYARRYEALACGSHQDDDKYNTLFVERPRDIIGTYVRLEALEVDRHLKDLFHVTSGQPALEKTRYDAQEVWGFYEEGPFSNPSELEASFVFQRKENEAGFALVQSITNQLIGAVLLRKDDPKNLTIQLEPPLTQPDREGTREHLESCFLLLDKLFAFGYRRIEISIDTQDGEKRKLAKRLGFTHEGCLRKHMVVKDSSRDSDIYGMLNSDWSKGARSTLFRKLYGSSALKADTNNERAESELQEREEKVKEDKVHKESKKKV